MFRSRSSVARFSSILTIPSLALATSAFAGPIWEGDLEDDAKQTPGTAQTVTTDGSVQMIKGQLTGTAFQGGGDYIDMYLVKITAPTSLLISTAGGQFGGGAQFDSQLFLFRAQQGQTGGFLAQGIFANNDASADNVGAFLTNSANDGSQFTITETGLYFIAITNKSVTAIGDNQEPIWPGLDVPGLRSFGGLTPFQAWGGTPSPDVGQYEIRLTGVSGVPAPGALALLGLAGLATRRRR
jgi:MYXO-CTERM domain-containing protein